MAYYKMAKPKATIKKSTIIYPAVFILPALVMIACGIIFKIEAIVPYIVAYALVAAIPGFFLISKDYGMAALVTSIVFVLGIGSYTVADNMLGKSDLVGDKAFLGAVSSVLQKFPAFVGQKDLEAVKVLMLESSYDPNTGSPTAGFKLTLGYDDALVYLRADNKEEYDSGIVEGYFKTATSEVPIADYSDLAKFVNLEYVSINQPNAYLYYYYGIAPGYLSKFVDLSIFENMKSLTELVIFNTAATDFAPIGKLASLENLSVQYCKVEDASVFGNLGALKNLNLTAAGLSDISFVSSLPGLTELYLPANEIADIDALKNLANLTDLVLNSNKIENVSPLGGKAQLKNLSLSDNQITDVSPLSGLASLESIYLSGNKIEDASPLFPSASVTYMDIGENALTVITGIEGCAALETLFVNDNKITDLSPIAGLKNLSKFYAQNNQIEDLSPLKEVITLTEVSLANNKIVDITPLGNLGNLTGVNLSENLITDFAPLEALEAMGTAITGKDTQLGDHVHDDEEDHGEE